MAQSPEQNATTSDIIRYDLGWNAINSLLRSGRSLSGHERNCCFLNTRGGRFANVSAAAQLDFSDDGRVLALADWDFDGDIDFWISNRSGPQVRHVRNDAQTKNHYVAFRLEGVNCNRDAIGARVSVRLADGTEQTKTLRAGEGYLAQCSKWIHFGLGAEKKIDRVNVVWPHGKSQTFSNVDADAWYQLVEDKALTTWKPPTVAPLEPSEFVAPPVTDRARIVLLNSIPIPRIEFFDEGENIHTVGEPASSAQLINLWATWCKPCLHELAEWKEHHSSFELAGVKVVALNLDQTGNEIDEFTVDSANQVLSELEIPFTAGFGTEQTATEFDVLQRALLSRQRPLPIPSSFLIDKDGRLRIVYKGPVSAETILQDARLINGDADNLLSAATPFDGKWISRPNGSTPLQVALKLIEANHSEKALEYIQSLVDKNEELSASLLNLRGAMLLDKKEFATAARSFMASLNLEPSNRQAHIELGTILLRFKKGARAAPHFEQVLQASPNDPELLYKLGTARAMEGKLVDAEKWLQESLSLRPYAPAHWQLANVFLGNSKAREAVEQFEAAIKLQPELAKTANNLAWILATHADATIRNEKRAVELATLICKSTKEPSASQLDTLAAAFAAEGRFELAVKASTRAIAIAKEGGDEGLAQRISKRQDLYHQQKPFREEN